MKIVVIYFILVNLIGFLMMGIDKSRAKRKAWRISEKALFTCAFIGGSFGMTAGMYTFRHKTRHWYFKYGLPAVLLVQVVLMSFIIK